MRKVLAALAAMAWLCAAPAVSQEDVGKPGTTQAATSGYQPMRIDLGGGIGLSFLARDGSVATLTAKADAVAVPGRAELAKVAVPDERGAFEVTISAFKPGFAAEAPAVSEQLLMEGGYGIAGASHASLTAADAWGTTLDDGKAQKVARSLCRTRQEIVVCLFLQGDAAHAASFEQEAGMLAGSLRFEDGAEDGFAASQMARLDLPLGDKGQLFIDYPSAFTVSSNEFGGDLPAMVQLEQGDTDNPLSVVAVGVSPGAPPASTEAIDAVADRMVSGWMDQNSALFAHPVLATKGDLVGLGYGDAGRSYAYIVDKRVGGGKAQIRVSLFASEGLRYSVLVATHYSPEVDETGPFFVRLGGVTGYDLVMRSILARLQQHAAAHD